MSPHSLLHRYWGHTRFRPLQEEAINTLLLRQDLLVLMPTGGGKSLCFQIPALLQPGLCLVVSPLIALMNDQVAQLRQRNIPAAAMHSAMSQQELDQVFFAAIGGQVKLLYVSPERLQSPLFQERLPQMNITLLAVDEAHCISQWGYDFRPSYLEIPYIKKLMGHVPTIALTATATARVESDILEQLNIPHAKILRTSFARPNLRYLVRKTNSTYTALLYLLRHIHGPSLIYVNTRDKARKFSEFLNKNNITADFYHGALLPVERSDKQAAWLAETTRVMLATSAFGMGIDKPNVRLVIHLDPPTTLEAYYQEAGRAGRDGQPAYAILLYEEHTLSLLARQAKRQLPDMQELTTVYHCLLDYCPPPAHQESDSHPFDLEDFVHKYHLAAHSTKACLRHLKKSRVIEYDETFFVPARVHFKADNSELYTFRLTHPTYEPLFCMLTQLYEAALKSSFSVSLRRVARLVDTTPAHLETQLLELAHRHLLTYTPATDLPQLTFLTRQPHAEALANASKALSQRKKIALQQLKASLHYVTHKHRCRAQILLEYFSEIDYTPCQQCDVCVAKNKKPLAQETNKRYKQQILDKLQTKAYNLQHLINTIDPNQGLALASVISQMVDEETLGYSEDLKLSCEL